MVAPVPSPRPLKLEGLTQDSPFDLCFIDGNHSYEAVKRDYEAFGENAKIAVFHDINDTLVARLEPVKAIEDLLAAVASLEPRFPDLRLVIIGGPGCVEASDYERRLRARTRELGIGDRVIFAGFHPRVLDLMLGMDVSVLPSLPSRAARSSRMPG